jgi:CarD family transcriptional regulator
MQFAVGDKVIHPRFGAGQITGEEHRELVKGFEHYFVIKVEGTGATAYIPIGKMADLGVRPVMSRTKLAQVLDTLRSVPRTLSKDFKQRQERIQEKLGTGEPIPVAEAVRDLTWHRVHKHLTQKDEDLLARGIGLLASEMALATDAEVFDSRETIETALKVARPGDPGAGYRPGGQPSSGVKPTASFDATA